MYKIQSSENNHSNNNFGIDQSKQQLINFIYRNVNLSNFKYDSLEVESELQQLFSKTYYVSANFSGSSCLLVCAKLQDRYHQFLVDRKTLSYNPKKIDIKNVKITPVKLPLDVDIYQGTIFDGTFVQNKNEKTFIITDVYMFKGQDFTKSQLESKLLTVRTYLESNYKEDKNNDITVTVNMLFPIEQTGHLMDKIIPKIKNFLIRGICFYPEISGTKLLYRFDNEQVNTQSNMQSNTKQFKVQNSDQYIKETPDVNISLFSKNNTNNVISTGSNESESNSPIQQKSQQLQSQQFIPKAPEIKKMIKTVYAPKKGVSDESYVFEMKKTESTEVYTLNIVEPIIKDNKTLLKRKQIGLAFIPNMAKSKWCKETMEQTDGNVLVHCKYHEDKYKWEPILISSSRKPSTIDEFKAIQIE